MMPPDTFQPAAFDAFAATYDATFSHTPLGEMLRSRVWESLARHFTPGQRILELACGTGEDAIWLARRGVRVMATDGSAEMLSQTWRKAKQAGVSLETRQLALQAIAQGLPVDLTGERFDGALSNFGGLNTLSDWSGLAQGLARLIRPGGKLVLVPMGPLCPWEIAWYGLHGDGRRAWRRLGRATAWVGSAEIPIYYPSARSLRRACAPHFRHVETRALGCLLPPSYLGHFVARYPRFFERLNRLERALARPLGGLGDHYLSVFERI